MLLAEFALVNRGGFFSLAFCGPIDEHEKFADFAISSVFILLSFLEFFTNATLEFNCD